MPQYRVEALEKFVVRTTYLVVTRNKKAAETLCRMGQVGGLVNQADTD